MTAAERRRGSGTREDPWVLTTPSGSSEYQMYRDEAADPPVIVCVVGKTVLGYQLRAHRRPARDAQGARRLGPSRQR